VEFLGHRGASFRCVIDDNWNEECSLVGHIAGSVRRQTPFAPEVALIAAFRIDRDHGDEQMAVVYLFSYAAVPGIAASELALVEPDLDPCRPQRCADALSRVRVLGGIAQKYSP
jgi:hypothetical protein